MSERYMYGVTPLCDVCAFRAAIWPGYIMLVETPLFVILSSFLYSLPQIK